MFNWSRGRTLLETCKRLGSKNTQYHPKLKLNSRVPVRLYSIFERESQGLEDKQYLVTTPIYYVNAAPHLGHFYSTLLADSQLRFQRLVGSTQPLLTTGTDEHGLKVFQAAQLHHLTPQSLCDKNSQLFHQLSLKVGVDKTNLKFIRTTDLTHKRLVQLVWNQLEEKGFIYKATYSGWYSISDESFYTDAEVEFGTSNQGHTAKQTGSLVEFVTEPTYYFRLSQFQERLLTFYKDNPDFVVPQTRYNEVLTKVRSGLTDLSISRPKSRVAWGISVPDDPTQTIYVWLDALFNYYTATLPNPKVYFPPNLQIIGKDILTFHTIYWPAFLMALDLPIPKQILAHGHWTVGGKKMSKSLNNGVDPLQLVAKFGLDATRYYLLATGGSSEDKDFQERMLQVRHDKELSDLLGNLLQRITSSKLNLEQKIVMEVTLNPILQLLLDFPELYLKAFHSLQPNKAILLINNLLMETNKFLQNLQPWKLEGTSKLKLQIMFTTFQSLRFAAIGLLPIIPIKANLVLDRLQVPSNRRSFNHLKVDLGWGDGVEQIKLDSNAKGILFPKFQNRV